jgi:hypothetical protein
MIAKKIIKIAQTGVHDAAQLSALAITQLASGKAASVGGLFFSSNVACWHKTDLPGRARHVSYRSKAAVAAAHPDVRN